MNEGRLAAGETLEHADRVPRRRRREPARRHASRGSSRSSPPASHCFQTNIVYDVDRFAGVVRAAARGGRPARGRRCSSASTPPRSTRMLRHMHDNIPGIEVDDATFARMDGLRGRRGEGRRASRSPSTSSGACASVPGVAGVHVMAPGWEAEAVPRVVAGAGIAAARPSLTPAFGQLRRRETTKASSLNHRPPCFVQHGLAWPRGTRRSSRPRPGARPRSGSRR